MNWIKKQIEKEKQKDTINNYSKKSIALEPVVIDTNQEPEKDTKNLIRMTAQEANEKGYFFRVNGQNCKIMTYKGTETCPIVPAYINGKPVRVIGKRAFAGSGIQDIILPDTIRLIREKAFYETCIRRIELPGDILKIEAGAFERCENLKEVVLRQAKERQEWRKIDVNASAFTKTPYIEQFGFVILNHILLRINLKHFEETQKPVRIPDGVRVIGEEAVERYWGVEEVEIPLSVKHIRKRAFASCSLRSVVFQAEYRIRPIIEKNAFGSFRRSCSNPFCYHLLREELQSDFGGDRNRTGWKRFRKLELKDFDDDYWWLDYNHIVNEREIYFPMNEIQNDLFSKLDISYHIGIGFCLSLDMADYYDMMIQISRMKDKIEMAICIVINGFRKKYQAKALDFLKQHINKAIILAVQDNNIYNIKFYQQYGLLEETTGLKRKTCEQLKIKYSNTASVLLSQIIQ